MLFSKLIAKTILLNHSTISFSIQSAEIRIEIIQTTNFHAIAVLTNTSGSDAAIPDTNYASN
jgi:hypothetical protein